MITLTLRISYDTALVFEGKDAAAFLTLLDRAKLAQQGYHDEGYYHWRYVGPDHSEQPKVEVCTGTISERADSSRTIKQLTEANSKLHKHKDLIDAAEALDP